MDAEQLRAIMQFLMERVRLKGERGAVIFDAPKAEEMAAAGLDPDGSRRILEAPWWSEMVTDVVETPEMCEPDDSPEEVLRYARDVVAEYIRKRATL